MSYLKHEISLKESCSTLPLTIMLFASFWSLIVNHFRNQSMNRFRIVIEQEIALPNAEEWATNTSSFFLWMHEEFLPAVWVEPIPGRFQGVIQMLGGVQLDIVRTIPGRCGDRWGMGGDAVDGVLALYEKDALCRGEPFRETQWLWLGAGVQTAHDDLIHLSNTSWIDAYTEQFGIRFLTYNANVGLLGMVQVSFGIAASGSIETEYLTQGTIVDPFG